MAPSGIREEYLFPNDSVSVLKAAHSAGIHKQKTTTTTDVHSVHVALRCE